MKWMMIVMLLGTGNGTGAAVNSVPFATKALCETAKAELRQGWEHRDRSGNRSIRTMKIVCVQNQ